MLVFEVILLILAICFVVWIATHLDSHGNVKWKDEAARKRNTIQRTEIITGGQATESAAGRALIGGMIAGTTGAVIGAASKRSKPTVQFLITYEDGHKEVETVEQGSFRMDTLLSHMK